MFNGDDFLKKIGKQTIEFDTPPTITECSSIVGPKEANGPLAKYFDKTLEDEFWGEKTWEKAESKIIKENVNLVISKAGIATNEIDCVFAGDLLNQCISSSFGLRDENIPFFGVFGACSTFVESMSLGAIAVEGFAILSKKGNGPYITHITPGKIVDMGIKDANNMGAAMAPAFCDTLITHFLDTGLTPSYYDAIISGDLGHIGKEIAIDIAKSKGYNIKSNYNDCGVLIFDKEAQDTHSGGSGCACCASVFSGYFFRQLKQKKLKKVLFIATGALMNSTSSQQGESIPGIAHAISIEI